ncbi:histidine kinase [Lacinutrix undariae]
MKLLLKYLILFFLCFPLKDGFAQLKIQNDKALLIKGIVREKVSFTPISKVNVEVNGGEYTITDADGRFQLKAKSGDELVVKHKDFETVYFTITSGDTIIIEVEANDDLSSNTSQKRNIPEQFKSLTDSASYYIKRDPEKSMQFVTDALSKSHSIIEKAKVYQLLADVYMELKQYDLAVTNYRTSLQNSKSNAVLLKLAKAYELNKNYQESIETYNAIDKQRLSNSQLINLYEGLGNTFFSIKDYKASVTAYEDGLAVAQKHVVTSKITDLNSKIAQSYNNNGQVDLAKGFFNNSLNLAEQENKARAVEEKNMVAEFNYSNKNYDDEIKIRKQLIEDILNIQSDSIIDNASPVTTQKQNYKIGNAYLLQKNYNKAIPYFEKSIVEADIKGDLVVKKDATKKLSDLYVDAGDFNKAKKVFDDYTAVTDALYIKKEQEITQAARLSRGIAEKQLRIKSLESDRALSESKYELTTERNKRQELIIYSLIGGLLLLLVTAYFMFKYIKQQRLANNLLALKSLRSQMNPHFIFNALNSVNSFIATNDERTANRYLSDFSYLMRAVLENSEEDFIPLEKEIELLQLYTKLEHFRFQDKFDYSITVAPEISVGDYKIPPMLLQPYIENAVWHGLRYKLEKGHLNILIDQKSANEISITITDDGIGREKSKALKTANQQKQNSKGMGNIKKRVAILNAMYKDKIDVCIGDFQDAEDAGTKVVVTIKKD